MNVNPHPDGGTPVLNNEPDLQTMELTWWLDHPKHRTKNYSYMAEAVGEWNDKFPVTVEPPIVSKT